MRTTSVVNVALLLTALSAGRDAAPPGACVTPHITGGDAECPLEYDAPDVISFLQTAASLSQRAPMATSLPAGAGVVSDGAPDDARGTANAALHSVTDVQGAQDHQVFVAVQGAVSPVKKLESSSSDGASRRGIPLLSAEPSAAQAEAMLHSSPDGNATGIVVNPSSQKSKLMLLAIELTGLGYFGVDRIYLGGNNFGLGIAKMLTAGGFGVWAALDWAVIVGNALSKQESIHALSMNYDFLPETVATAHFVGIVAIVAVVAGTGTALFYGAHKALTAKGFWTKE